MSDRKAYNPRSFCRSYVMDNEPLNTCDQKDMTEFFNDLIAKLEDMTPELRDLVHNLFRGEITNSKLLSRCVWKIFIHLIQLLHLVMPRDFLQTSSGIIQSCLTFAHISLVSICIKERLKLFLSFVNFFAFIVMREQTNARFCTYNHDLLRRGEIRYNCFIPL